MLSIPTRIANFPPQSGVANGSANMILSWDELVWAAISVGRGSLGHIQQHGVFSMFEIAYRSAILYANLVESDGGGIVRSSAYEGLDPSEKSAISYLLGMTL